MTLQLPNTIANGQDADGDKLQQNFATVAQWGNAEAITSDGATAMVAPLLLPAAMPTQPNQAASKAYVDAGIPVGSMTMFAGDLAPDNWLFCRGQSVSRATYAALFAAIGTRFGSVDGTTFNLPNLQGTVPVGYNSNVNPPAGLTGKFTAGVGERGGSTDTTLPSHAHTTVAHAHGLGNHFHGVADHLHYAAGIAGTTYYLNVTNIGNNLISVGGGGPQKIDFFPNTGGATAPISTGGPSGPSDVAAGLATDAQGAAPTNTNLQPYLTLNFLIKVQ